VSPSCGYSPEFTTALQALASLTANQWHSYQAVGLQRLWTLHQAASSRSITTLPSEMSACCRALNWNRSRIQYWEVTVSNSVYKICCPPCWKYNLLQQCNVEYLRCVWNYTPVETRGLRKILASEFWDYNFRILTHYCGVVFRSLQQHHCTLCVKSLRVIGVNTDPTTPWPNLSEGIWTP